MPTSCPECGSGRVGTLGPDLSTCDDCGHGWEFDPAPTGERPPFPSCPGCFGSEVYACDSPRQGFWECPDCAYEWKPTPAEKGYARRDHDGPLYHITSPHNRSSIQANGLEPRTEGVFMTTTPAAWTYVFGQIERCDIWAVDTRGLELYPDYEGGDPGVDFVHTELIGPERLKLHQRAGAHEEQNAPGPASIEPTVQP